MNKVVQNSLFCDKSSDKFYDICKKIGVDNNLPGWPDKFGYAIRKWIQYNNIPQIKTLSLFSGAGGLDIGFSDVGFDIITSVEIDNKFCDTLRLNTGSGRYFSNSEVRCIDIRDYSANNLTNIDFIIGGPPCQTFSAAGRRANGVLGTTDSRGVLFREYVRILNETKPKCFLFENVYGIVGAEGGKPWREILEAFSSIGYKLFYRIIDAADYGVPQHRERLLIVGLRDGFFKFPRPTHGPDSIDNALFYNAQIAIDDVQSEESDASNELGGRYAHLLPEIPPGLNYSFFTEEMGHPNPIFAWRSKFSDFLYKADPNMPVRTIKALGGAYTGPLHWNNRFFKYEEYKRLQTFPDDYDISGTKQIAVKQIGNSVPPQLARIMAIAIRHQIFKTEFPFKLSYLENYEELSFRKRKHELTELYRIKAEKAISTIKLKKPIKPISRNYYCNIYSNFKFEESPASTAQYYIEITWNDNLIITVQDAVNNDKKMYIHIVVEPNGTEWSIGVKRVVLNVYSKSKFGLTVAWKAFESELIRNKIKADLVQLNGYYQYTPKIISSSEFNDSIPYASVLRNVTNSKDVPRILITSDIAKEWEISPSNVYDAALYLRSLGYEIRNHSTNPQIKKNFWLVPYSFPTLTPLSVQLTKKL